MDRDTDEVTQLRAQLASLRLELQAATASGPRRTQEADSTLAAVEGSGDTPPPPNRFRQEARCAPIDKFSGRDRAHVERFAWRMRQRLQAIGELHTPYGLEFATSHFSGHADDWYYAAARRTAFTSWTQLEPIFLEYWRPASSLADDIKALRAIRQTGTVDSYCQEFGLLALRLKQRLDDETLRHHFIDGIVDGFKVHVLTMRAAPLDKLIKETAILASKLPPSIVLPNPTGLTAAVEGNSLPSTRTGRRASSRNSVPVDACNDDLDGERFPWWPGKRLGLSETPYLRPYQPECAALASQTAISDALHLPVRQADVQRA